LAFLLEHLDDFYEGLGLARARQTSDADLDAPSQGTTSPWDGCFLNGVSDILRMS
jgi:hypothetical protein